MTASPDEAGEAFQGEAQRSRSKLQVAAQVAMALRSTGSAGDRVAIEGIGRLENPVVEER